ncbi:Fanconi anemia group M protein [Microplitis demolitor]|uniref:Fanconi anemia group M protein n=1 Tax=Microplitis demolitor TaxID=69319 RepID=UPI0004CD3DAC|nr:Fanconi anemia group M protein [Microplitis demolitor]
MDLLSQEPLFSTDPSTVGFDISAGKRWIYPENYPVREYQFSIVKTSLFQNTLVCLPTGLGKTFIAAVVMYNFWRWYPRGIIVFLAPTKPLVAQQIDACHDIMGIPISETIQLTGVIHQKERKIAWHERRVIFATPQTFQYDLAKNIIPKELVKCVIIDEAHRALGKHAYCECIRMLNEKNKFYRLVALSATPGSKLEAVQEVINNLHISRLELRDDASPDILPYINQKNIQIVEVGMNDQFKNFYDRYINIMDPLYRVLLKNNIIKMDISSLSKGKMFYIRNDFQKNKNKRFNYGELYNTINILSTMVYAKDLMIYHGLRTFHKFYQNHSDKPWINGKPELLELLDEVNQYLGSFPDIQELIDGNDKAFADMNVVYGHRKYEKLQEILTDYFTNAEENKISTRVIVFSEFRESVSEIYVSLYKLQPLIRPQIFVGQAHLMNQAQQKKAIENFRNNKVNVLISTSVGEEGLDVGEVDLIVCFDTTGKGPTRLVQRIGRTGRKRDGRVIVLVTDAKEHQTLKSALISKDNLNAKVMQSRQVKEALNDNSPRMVPDDLEPECLKMKMTVIPVTPRTKSKRKVGDKKKAKAQPKRKYTKRKSKDNFEEAEDAEVEMEETISKFNKTRTKKGKQSSLMSFFQQSTVSNCRDSSMQDDEVVCMRVEEVSRAVPQVISQLINYNNVRIKPTNAKLLSSDNEADNFLTLCAMKESEKNINQNNKILNFIYMPNFVNNEDMLDNFKIPSLKVLDCIVSLTEYVPPVQEELDEFDEFYNDLGDWDNDFVGYNQQDDCNNYHEAHSSYHDYQNQSNYYQDNGNCSKENYFMNQKSKFEALLDDSTDDDDLYQPDEILPPHERINLTEDILDVTNTDDRTKRNQSEGTLNETISVVTGGAFEDLLNTSSDESVEEINSSPSKSESSLNRLEIKQAKDVSMNCQVDTVPVVNNLDSDTLLVNRLEANDVGISDCEEDVVPVNDLEADTIPVNDLEADTIAVNNVEVEVNNLRADKIPVTDSDTLIISKLPESGESQIKNDKKTSSQVLTQDNFDNIDFESDFGSWEKEIFQRNVTSQDNKNIMDSNDTLSSKNKAVNSFDNVKRSTNLVISSQNPSINTDLNYRNKLINISNGEIDGSKKDDCHSPDLVRHSNHRRSTQSKLNRTLDFLGKQSLEMTENSYGNIHSTAQSDDDIFDNESLIADSDFEDQLRAVENSNDFDKISSSNIKDCNNKNKVDKLKDLDNIKNSLPLSCSSPVQLKINDRNLPLEPINVDSNLIETYVDDCNWDSDFETSSAPITECKYFGNYSETVSENIPTTSKQSTNDKVNVQRSQKENNPNWLSAKTADSKKINQENSLLKTNKFGKNRFPALKFNSRSNLRKDSSDSDSDFAPTKIVKNVFHNRENIYNNEKKLTSDSTLPVNNNIIRNKFVLPKPNSPKSLSLSNLTKFAAPSRATSKLSSSSKTTGTVSTSSWIDSKKSSSLDSFPKRKQSREKNRKKRKRNGFIDDEAEVSGDDHSPGHSGDDDDGADLEDFVSYSQYHDNSVDMKAHYLQSVKSPRRPGKFLIRKPKSPPPDLRIYSQIIPDEPNTYLYDSFCVEDDEIPEELSSDEVTVIEINNSKNKKKRKRDSSQDTRSKRKRIIINSDTSDDEIEILRVQIADESLMLKNK